MLRRTGGLKLDDQPPEPFGLAKGLLVSFAQLPKTFAPATTTGPGIAMIAGGNSATLHRGVGDCLQIMTSRRNG